MSPHDASQDVTSATSAVWAKHVPAPGAPGGYTLRAGRIHVATYVEDCKLVYVHDGAFAFHPADTAG